MPAPNKNWALLSFEEALSSLDDRILPLPSVEDFAYLLHKCRKEKNRSYALRLHAHLRECGLDAHASLGNSLIPVLVGAGCMDAAQQVFDKLAHRNSFSWNFLITGYVQHGLPQYALTLYQSMASLLVSGDAFVALLKACTNLKNMELGSKIHAEVAKNGLLERNLFVANSVVDMYAKCGCLAEAQGVFDIIRARDAILWTALIAGYAEYGCGKEALCCFQQMQHEGFSPDAITFVCSLKACRTLGSITRGQELFADIVRRGLERELLVGNILVDMYAKCGLIAEAQAVFDNHLIRSVVSWNTLITAYEGHGCCEEALQCFEEMQHQGIFPDAITFVCCLKACGSLGVSDKGREIHADVSRKGLEKDTVVGSALVDMYAKCGSLAEAQEVFNQLQYQDVVSWTALIAGFSQCGQIQMVCNMFDRMIEGGTKPNFITFVSILTVCNHAGLLEKGEMYLDSMCKYYGIIPVRKHYTCLIDLLGRAGHIDRAIALTKKMPFHPGIVVWHTLQSACQKWGNVELGRLAFEHSIQLDNKDAGSYICMSNIYANAGMGEDANRVEAMRLERQAWNWPEFVSWGDTALFAGD